MRIVSLSLLLSASLLAQAPRIFYSDLDGGPNTGGENDHGAYVTVYGAYFGSTRGSSTVTVGGQPVASYPLWTANKVTFQLGRSAASGEIRLATASGQSNGVPFVVRPGNIRFVSTSGSDGNVGSFAAPWRTVQKAVTSIFPGDIIYVMNGVVETRVGTSDGSVSLSRNHGTAGSPKALIGYPNAVATVGSIGSGPCSSTQCTEGIKVTYASDYWTVANLYLRGNNDSIVVRGAGWRLIGNDMSCPFGDGASSCLNTSEANNMKVYGNNVHESGRAGASSLYHGVYFSTDSNNIDLGWNRVTDTRGCRGIQIHSTPSDGNSGQNQFNILIHDNVVINSQCDGIVLSTVDPSRGPVQVYNNLIVNAGQGPAHPFDSGNFSCIYVAGYTSRGTPGLGTVEVFNNTMANCGGLGRQNAGVAFARRDTQLSVRLRNNIIHVAGATPYIVTDSAAVPFLTGVSNLFAGNGLAPTAFDLTNSISADPLFAGTNDFHLRSGSPARGNGVDTGLATDLDGRARTAPHDIGAYTGEGAPGVIPSNGTFTLALSPAAVSVAAGASAAQALVTVLGSGGFSGQVDITCVTQGLINCVGTTAGPGQSGTLLVRFPGLAAGTYTVTVQGVSNGRIANAALTLSVQPDASGGGPGNGSGRSLAFRPGGGYGSAVYSSPAAITEYRVEFRVHGLGSAGTILQTNDGALGSVTFLRTDSGYRIQFSNQTLFFGSPACTADFAADDITVRLEREGFSTSISLLDPSGNPVGGGQCQQTVPAPTALLTSLTVGAGSGGTNAGAFNLAWLRLQRKEFGSWTNLFDYQFEDSLSSSSGPLSEPLTWVGSEPPAFVATGDAPVITVTPPAGAGVFDIDATPIRITRGTPSATSTVRIFPRTALGPFAQATVDCPQPPLGVACSLASPAVGAPSVITLTFNSLVAPGEYRISLRGRMPNASGQGVLLLTVDAGSFSADPEFGNRSLQVSPANSAAMRIGGATLQLGDFRLEARLHGVNPQGVLLNSNQGSALGTISISTLEEGGALIRMSGQPFSTPCSMALSYGELADFVLRIQRSGGVYTMEAWSRSAGTRITACQTIGGPGNLSELMLSQMNDGGFFSVAWLRLYSSASNAAPAGSAGAAGLIANYEFEDQLGPGTGELPGFGVTAESPFFVDTPRR